MKFFDFITIVFVFSLVISAVCIIIGHFANKHLDELKKRGLV